MEKKLKQLFDYQKFEQNAALQRIIDAAHGKYGELDDEELENVAGGQQPFYENGQPPTTGNTGDGKE